VKECSAYSHYLSGHGVKVDIIFFGLYSFDSTVAELSVDNLYGCRGGFGGGGD
jgi:hypothetical protein